MRIQVPPQSPLLSIYFTTYHPIVLLYNNFHIHTHWYLDSHSQYFLHSYNTHLIWVTILGVNRVFKAFPCVLCGPDLLRNLNASPCFTMLFPYWESYLPPSLLLSFCFFQVRLGSLWILLWGGLVGLHSLFLGGLHSAPSHIPTSYPILFGVPHS